MVKYWLLLYLAAQITPEIHKFSIPVFGLNAIDDPMQPGEDLPIKQAIQKGSNLALIVTERGGHLGFLEGIFPFRKPFHYMERLVGEFVNAIRLHAEELLEEKTVDNLEGSTTLNEPQVEIAGVCWKWSLKYLIKVAQI